MKEESNKTSDQYQRMTWDALRKSLNGLINKVNVKNIKDILPEIFSEVCQDFLSLHALTLSHQFPSIPPVSIAAASCPALMHVNSFSLHLCGQLFTQLNHLHPSILYTKKALHGSSKRGHKCRGVVSTAKSSQLLNHAGLAHTC